MTNYFNFIEDFKFYITLQISSQKVKEEALNRAEKLATEWFNQWTDPNIISKLSHRHQVSTITIHDQLGLYVWETGTFSKENVMKNFQILVEGFYFTKLGLITNKLSHPTLN